uniref:Uncharacterized protein n=1 Tax=Anguilla anguilla TaxID=7936 RepID=A0A0E9R8T0_ANGAN
MSARWWRYNKGSYFKRP